MQKRKLAFIPKSSFIAICRLQGIYCLCKLIGKSCRLTFRWQITFTVKKTSIFDHVKLFESSYFLVPTISDYFVSVIFWKSLCLSYRTRNGCLVGADNFPGITPWPTLPRSWTRSPDFIQIETKKKTVQLLFQDAPTPEKTKNKLAVHIIDSVGNRFLSL